MSAGRGRPDVCPKTRKISYRTRKQALTGTTRAADTGKRRLYVYKCRDCRRWHLTSKAEPEGTP